MVCVWSGAQYPGPGVICYVNIGMALLLVPGLVSQRGDNDGEEP